MPKEIELPDGSVVDFPDTMDDAQIEDVLRGQFGEFPGMPQGLKRRASPFGLGKKIGGGESFTEFGDESIPEPEPPELLRRPEPPPDKRSPNEQFGTTLHRDEQGRALSFPHMIAPDTPESQAIAGAAAALGAGGAGLMGLGALRAGGAVEGAGIGYKRGGVKGAVAGAGLGATFPGATTLAGIGDALGGTEGGVTALGAGLVAKQLAKKYGLGGVVDAVSAARTSSRVGKAALSAEKQAALEASRAAREAKAAELLAAVRGSEPAAAGAVGKAERSNAIAKALEAKFGRGAATAVDDLESAVRASAEKARVESALKGSRVQSGAERVGRPLGKTKEQIRMETGPVLDEAVGDASPILPEKILFQMIDKMKSLPKTGGEREAYVARALDGKTKAQVENIRRTLQHLGLLLPVGVAGAMSQE